MINVNFQLRSAHHAELSRPHLHFEPEQDECVDGEDSGAGGQQAQDVEGGPGEVLVDGHSVVLVESEQRQL